MILKKYDLKSVSDFFFFKKLKSLIIKMKCIKTKPKLVESYHDVEKLKDFTGIVKDENNNIFYYLNGKCHRTDGPAVEWADGDRWWYLNGQYYGENNDFTKESWIKFVKLELLK